MFFELNVVLYVLLFVFRWIYQRFFVIHSWICRNSRTFFWIFIVVEMFFKIRFHSMLNSFFEINWNEKNLACFWYWMKWKLYFQLHESILQILSIFMINVRLFHFHFNMCDDIRINDVWDKNACFCNKHFESLQSAIILIFDWMF